jgi:hypothetical protein
MLELIRILAKLKLDSLLCRVSILLQQRQIAVGQQIQPVYGLPIIMSAPISGVAQQPQRQKPYLKRLKAPA